MENKILSRLPGDYPWADLFQVHDCLGSTNDYLKSLVRAGAPEGTAVMALEQTKGHGRMGRSFHSPAGSGVYLSLLLKPDCEPLQLMHLTCAAAGAMVEAVEKAAGITPGIKWTNDLVWGKRKLGGILTELCFRPDGALEGCIIGIGINCCQQEGDFPQEIRDIACSLSMAAGRPIDPWNMAAAMACALEKMSRRLLTDKEKLLNHYRSHCMTLGQEISLVRGQERSYGKALDITDDGALLVRFLDGQIRPVSSGEVSVRGMYGYV